MARAHEKRFRPASRAGSNPADWSSRGHWRIGDRPCSVGSHEAVAVTECPSVMRQILVPCLIRVHPTPTLCEIGQFFPAYLNCGGILVSYLGHPRKTGELRSLCFFVSWT